MIFCSKNTSVFCLRSCLCIVDLKSGNYVELMSQSHSETTDGAFRSSGKEEHLLVRTMTF